MLWSPVAHQRFLNDLFTRMDAVIPQFGQHRRISLAREDRIYNRQTSDACDFADHMVDLQIHLRQRFLHMLNMLWTAICTRSLRWRIRDRTAQTSPSGRNAALS